MVTERSELVVTVSVSEAKLLVLLGSNTALLTETLLVWLPGGVSPGTVKLAVTVALAPLGMVPRSQLKLGKLLQEPWLGVTAP